MRRKERRRERTTKREGGLTKSVNLDSSGSLELPVVLHDVRVGDGRDGLLDVGFDEALKIGFLGGGEPVSKSDERSEESSEGSSFLENGKGKKRSGKSSVEVSGEALREEKW